MNAPALTLTAAAPAPVRPAAWFANPGLGGPTPLTVEKSGRAFGHLATFDQCHIGISDQCVLAPRSATDYAYFTRGTVMTDEGPVRTGVITMSTGHADLHFGFADTVSHYDHTGTAVLDVCVGEDEHGIWMAGAVREGVTDEQVRVLQAAGACSGDWRLIGGNLELVAALAVNVPGFPIPRPALAASGAGDTAMVAISVVPHDDHTTEIAQAVIAALDAREARRARLAKVLPVAAEVRAERVARVLASIEA